MGEINAAQLMVTGPLAFDDEMGEKKGNGST